MLHRFPKLSRKVVLVLLAVVCLGAGIGMETISKWGPWMDLVSIYIIPIGATLGAVSWFFIMKKDDLLAAVNTGSGKRMVRFGIMWAVLSMCPGSAAVRGGTDRSCGVLMLHKVGAKSENLHF